MDNSPAQAIPLRRRLAAEALGTSFLLIAVAGSGILGERLAAGNTADVSSPQKPPERQPRRHVPVAPAGRTPAASRKRGSVPSRDTAASST